MTARRVVAPKTVEPEPIEPELIDGGSEMTEPEQVAVVINPVEVNPYSAQPAPHLKPNWDENELDPTNRLSIAEDPDGSKNAARLKDAIERHQGLTP